MDNYIDLYCERLAPGLWDEPVNALTNISFFIAAVFALILARREVALDWRSGLLIGFLFAIGTGSTLFHTLAVFWAMLSDSLPILFYQIAFLSLYSVYVMRLASGYVFILLGGFFLTMFAFMQLPSHWLNGSLEYAPALLFLLGLAVWHYKNAAREKFLLGLAGLVFIVSLSLRSADAAVCASFPIGTHFAWHLLNGAVLYMTTRAFILNRH